MAQVSPGVERPDTVPMNATHKESAPPVARTVIGGFLMGLANLVPGISGGTMILAIGLYDRFISAVADVTRFRWKRPTLVFLALMAVGLGTAVVSLSGVAVDLVANHRWVMYSLFIGMTLGGVPELWRASRPLSIPVLLAIVLGLALIIGVSMGLASTSLPQTIPVFLIVGAAAASSMILPGISGSYILLICGMYSLVIGSMSFTALREDMGASLRIIVPVAVGAVIGIALLSNVLKFLLSKFSRTSHGALLGLLVGSVLGLWPFQEPVHPDLARKPYRKATVMLLAGKSHEDVRDKYGDEFDDGTLGRLESEWAGREPGELKALGEELQRFDPTGKQIASALGLLIVGFGMTRLLGKGSGKAADGA
ncbi:MAG: putative membrane protein [Chlamydiales bacterium]|jgi:putative membrane protein